MEELIKEFNSNKLILKLEEIKGKEEYKKIYQKYRKELRYYLKDKKEQDIKEYNNIIDIIGGLNYIEFNEIYKMGILDGINLNKKNTI